MEPDSALAIIQLRLYSGGKLSVSKNDLDKRMGTIKHRHFYDLPQFLRPGDCLVLNDSRVLPARNLNTRKVEFNDLVPRKSSAGHGIGAVLAHTHLMSPAAAAEDVGASGDGHRSAPDRRCDGSRS